MFKRNILLLTGPSNLESNSNRFEASNKNSRGTVTKVTIVYLVAYGHSKFTNPVKSQQNHLPFGQMITNTSTLKNIYTPYLPSTDWLWINSLPEWILCKAQHTLNIVLNFQKSERVAFIWGSMASISFGWLLFESRVCSLGSCGSGDVGKISKSSLLSWLLAQCEQLTY